MQNNKKTIFIYILIAVFLVGGLYLMTTMFSPQAETPKYSDVIFLFQDDNIEEFTFDLGNGELTAVLKEGVTIEGAKETDEGDMVLVYRTPSPVVFYETINTYIEEFNIENPEERVSYDYKATVDNSSFYLSMIPTVLLIGALIFVAIFTMRQAGGGGKIGQFGKVSKSAAQTGVKTTFAEVAGADEEKEELAEIVEFLKKPKSFSELGARIPKGVLLMGPPGTGKTLLARAVAGEAGVPFFSISGSDFVEMYVGVGASRVRSLFDEAKKGAPAIIFIDEIDAVGRQRGAGLGGGHDEREQTLNQLLVEMDGFGVNEGIIIIAATNRSDILDPALLRPGRFDRQVVVGRPDVKGREEILKVHARNKPLGFDVDLKVIARSTAGFTGADLENLLNEAALLAARRKRKAITGKDIAEATLKVVAGPEKRSHKIHDEDKKITAYHEAGHAVVAHYSKTQDPVHEVSIVPRGMAAGYTMNLPEEDRTHLSKRKMQESLQLLLGGRVAEQITLDDICTGASNDIERATATARSMVTRYGFSSRLGPIVYGQAEQEVFLGRDFNHQRNYSETVAAEIDEEIRLLIDGAYERAKEILEEHKDQLELVAKYLLAYEKIDAKTFKDIMDGNISLQSVEDELQKQEEEKKKLLETAESEEAAKVEEKPIIEENATFSEPVEEDNTDDKGDTEVGH